MFRMKFEQSGNDDSEDEWIDAKERTAGVADCSRDSVLILYKDGKRTRDNSHCHPTSSNGVDSKSLSSGTDLEELEIYESCSPSQCTQRDELEDRAVGSQHLAPLQTSQTLARPSLSPSTQSPGYEADSYSDTERRSIESTEDKPAIQEKLQGNGIFFYLHNSKGKTEEDNPANTGFEKPWEELSVGGHKQDGLDRFEAEEARGETSQLPEEEEQERRRQVHELKDLAHCFTCDALPRENIEISKLKKLLRRTGMSAIFRFLKNPWVFFRRTKEEYSGYYPHSPNTKKRVAKSKKPSRCKPPAIFDVASATTNANLETMRYTRRVSRSGPVVVQFATVVSTQRDVEPWTREQYLRKNGRIPDRFCGKTDDDEFGGIEGNNLMNPVYNNSVVSGYDSDSD